LAGFFNNAWVRRLAVWILAPVVLIYGYFQFNYPTCTFRYKLTAEVMTPGGLKRGSSVIEVSYSHNGDWGGGKSADLNMVGEAVYVDLGQGKNLFVTLSSNESGRNQFLNPNYAPLKGALNAYAMPLKVFDLKWTFGKERELCAAASKIPLGQKKAAFPLFHTNLPTLVTFRDLYDPDSISVVQPLEIDKVLGQNFKIKSIALEMTNEAPTSTGMKIFPWWEAKEQEQKKIKSLGQGQTLINNILDSAFRRPGIWDNNE
jgi:hypothetical protein